VIDGAGRAVSFIQSLYWEFGSGVVGQQTGVLFQNRGASFRLDSNAANALAPGKKPFHTLNPAYARLKDGRQLVYGTMLTNIFSGRARTPARQAADILDVVFHGILPAGGRRTIRAARRNGR